MHGSESSTLETDVCVWRYAPLVVHAAQEEEEEEDAWPSSISGRPMATKIIDGHGLVGTLPRNINAKHS